jgi:hypothetical protein
MDRVGAHRRAFARRHATISRTAVGSAFIFSNRVPSTIPRNLANAIATRPITRLTSGSTSLAIASTSSNPSLRLHMRCCSSRTMVKGTEYFSAVGEGGLRSRARGGCAGGTACERTRKSDEKGKTVWPDCVFRVSDNHHRNRHHHASTKGPDHPV